MRDNAAPIKLPMMKKANPSDVVSTTVINC